MPDKPDPALGWKFVEKLLREEDLERLDQASDEEVERQMLAAGIDPQRVPTAEELIARATERARKRRQQGNGPAQVAALPVRPRRREWVVWLVAAAVGAVVVTLAVERREIDAWWHRGPAPIGPDLQRPQPPPTPEERAARLRDEAFGACGGGLWALCERKLDEARQLDPGGESDLRVQGARKAVHDGLNPDEGKKPAR